MTLCDPEISWWWELYDDTTRFDLEMVLDRFATRLEGMASHKGVRDDDHSAGSELFQPPIEPAASTYPERAAWLKRELAMRKWTVHDLQRWGGPNWKTSQKVLGSLSVRPDVLEKIAEALSKKQAVVSSEDIPQK